MISNIYYLHTSECLINLEHGRCRQKKVKKKTWSCTYRCFDSLIYIFTEVFTWNYTVFAINILSIIQKTCCCYKWQSYIRGHFCSLIIENRRCQYFSWFFVFTRHATSNTLHHFNHLSHFVWEWTFKSAMVALLHWLCDSVSLESFETLISFLVQPQRENFVCANQKGISGHSLNSIIALLFEQQNNFFIILGLAVI